jgi:hypothetical protein
MLSIPVRCNVSVISNGDSTTQATANIKLCIDVAVAHPHIAHYLSLCDNKLARNDMDGYIFNAEKYFSLVDTSVQQSLEKMLQSLSRKMSRLTVAMLAVMLIGIAGAPFYAWSIPTFFAIALTVMVSGIGFLSRRYSSVDSYRHWLQSSKEERFGSFCRTKAEKAGLTSIPDEIAT